MVLQLIIYELFKRIVDAAGHAPGPLPDLRPHQIIEAVDRDLLDESAEYKAVTYDAVNFGTVVPIYQRVPTECSRCTYAGTVMASMRAMGAAGSEPVVVSEVI